MSPHLSPRSQPPTRVRRPPSPVDTSRRSNLRLRPGGFWAGLGGTLLTLLGGALVITLMVGWVLLWAFRPGGPSVALLVLGTVAFTVVLALLWTLLWRIRAKERARHQEAVLLTGLSHGLRTPLAGIRTAAQTLRQPGLAQEQRAALLEAVVDETRRLGLRIDNLLETTRISVERSPFWSGPVDLGKVVRAVAADLGSTVRAHGGSMELRAEGSFPCQGDAQALRLLVENLIDNALKYGGPSPRVDLHLHCEGKHALLQVGGGGQGFEGGSGERYFKRFARGDGGSPGSGLGLTIARAIARGHGGEIHLWSAGPGEGATAEVWLPLDPPEEIRPETGPPPDGAG